MSTITKECPIIPHNKQIEYARKLMFTRQLDDKTKALVLDFAKREIYDETIDLKCLNCDYEELNQDYEEIEEIWDGIDFLKLYCPKCGKLKFVPIDIWKLNNKYKK